MHGTTAIRGSSAKVMLGVLGGQIVLGAILATGLLAVYGPVAGYSALLGSLICAIPNGFLALRLSMPRRDPGARALMRAAYVGEAGKLTLTVLMFTAVFVLVRPLAAPALFAGFIAAQLVTIVGLLMRNNEQQDTR